MKWFIIAYTQHEGKNYGSPGLYGPFESKDHAMMWEAYNVPHDVKCEFIRNQIPDMASVPA